jgi:hypothetical protein
VIVGERAMVRRIDENGFRWLEPPYTPEEQMLLGGKPSVSRKPACRDVLGFSGRHLRALFSGR